MTENKARSVDPATLEMLTLAHCLNGHFVCDSCHAEDPCTWIEHHTLEAISGESANDGAEGHGETGKAPSIAS